MDMNDPDLEQLDEELDALLQRCRPAANPSWVATTERRLLPIELEERGWWRAPQVRVGAAAAFALAAVLLVLTLAGALDGGSEDVRAKGNCEQVLVSRVERVPVIVTSNGQSRVVYRQQRVRRFEQRCR